jgi:DNA-binding transcriptional ArsR family regulator
MMDLPLDPPLDLSEASAVKALAALAQASRLRVFRAIVGAGPEGMQPGQISQALGVPANTLSFHLKELHHAALVSVQREGRFLRYRADLGAMQSLMDFLTAHCCQGVPCGDTLNLACEPARC